jgi:hypothetical protein
MMLEYILTPAMLRDARKLLADIIKDINNE